MRIGQVAGSGAIEPVEVLSTQLMAKYGEIVADGVKRPRLFLARVVLPKGVPAVIELVTEGDMPGDAVALLERIRAGIHLVHDGACQRGVVLLTERLRNLDAQRKALQLQLDESSALLERLSQRDVAQASPVMLERSRIASQITGLDAERLGLAQRLLPPQTHPTELVGTITAPARPAAPRKVLIGALAVALGLIAGVMLALVADFLTKAR